MFPQGRSDPNTIPHNLIQQVSAFVQQAISTESLDYNLIASRVWFGILFSHFTQNLSTVNSFPILNQFIKHGVTKASNHPETSIHHSVEDPESIVNPLLSQVGFNQSPMSRHVGAQRFRTQLFKQGFGLRQHPVLTKPSNNIIVTGNIHGKRLRIRLSSNLLKSGKGFLKVAKLKALTDHNIEGIRVNSLEIGRGVIVQHLIKQSPSLSFPAMLEQHLQQNITSGRGHPKLALQQGLVGLHGLLIPTFIEEPFHKCGIHDSIIDEATLLKLIEELIGLVQIVQFEKPRNEIVINKGIGAVALGEHLAQEVDGFGNATSMDQTLGEMAIGDGGGTERSVGDDVAIDFESNVDVALVAVCVDEIVVRDDVGDDVGLFEEEVEEGDGVLIAVGAVHGGDDGVAGEDGGASDGEDGVAGDGGGGVEVGGADEGLDAVVEAEARADEGGGGVRKARGVGVAGRALVGWRTNGVERRLDAETALPSTTLGGGFFGGGERVGTGLGEREHGAGGAQRHAPEENPIKRHLVC